MTTHFPVLNKSDRIKLVILDPPPLSEMMWSCVSKMTKNNSTTVKPV